MGSLKKDEKALQQDLSKVPQSVNTNYFMFRECDYELYRT